MKTLLSIALTLCVFPISSAQITFQKAYGLNGGDLGYCVQQTSDGGYIITGKVRMTNTVSHDDLYLIKTDAFGDTLWTRIYGKITTNEVGYSVKQTSDGGYIVTGNAYTSAGVNVYLIKTTATGDTIWTKTFGGTAADQGYDVKQTNDGGYIITGRTSSFGLGPDNVYLLKTDASGSLTWTKTYGGPNPDYGNAVYQTTDGGYIIGGVTYSFPPGDENAYLIKTDSAGNLTWSKTYGGTSNDAATAVEQTTDNGYILSGETESFGSGGADVFLIKTDANGDTLWTRALGGTGYDYGKAVSQTHDGGYIIGGRTSSFGSGVDAIYLVKIDSGGNYKWSRTYGGGSFQDFAFSMQQTADQGYIITGLVTSLGVSGDVCLIKTDSLGNTVCNFGTPSTIVSIPSTAVGSPSTTTSSGGVVTGMFTTVGSGCNISDCSTAYISENGRAVGKILMYPNPVNGKLNIQFHADTERNCHISLFDVTGRSVLSEEWHTAQGENLIELNLENYANGIYMLVLNKGNETERVKVILE